MSILIKEECEAMYEAYLREREDTDTVWFVHKKSFDEGQRGIQVMNNKELKQQAKMWRKHKRAGKIQMLECNNKTKVIEGETYYMLCLQTKDCEHDDLDSVALMLAGEMVSGCCYFFRNQKNRDEIFRYVNTPKLEIVE